jgi:hypothetical protein
MKIASTVSIFYKIPPNLPFLLRQCSGQAPGGTPLPPFSTLGKGGLRGVKEGVGEIARLWRFFLIAGFFILSGCASVKPVDQSDGRAAAPAEASGIKIERIHPSVGGQMLDMRYRVVDVGKAKLAMNRTAQIYLIDQASGMKLPVPNMAKVGKLQQHPEKTEGDKVFWIFFNNPGAMVKPGAKVTLVIDGIRIEDIVVQ